MKDSTGLRVADLVIGYESPLHEPFTFNVAPGDVLAVVGPSGCGKSTLLGTIAGLTPALGGSIEIGGRDITALPINERRVAMVFQEALLFPHLNVRDNVAYGPRRAGISREEARAEADRLLTWVDLEGYGDRSIEQLSGGQAQRVSLARALAAKPDALCLDEPFSALGCAFAGTFGSGRAFGHCPSADSGHPRNPRSPGGSDDDTWSWRRVHTFDVRAERLRKRAARIDRTYTRIAAATTIAAFLAYIAGQYLPYASAVPAAITAVVATQVSFHQATKGAFIQVLGALLGAAVALGIVSVVGSGALSILLLVALCFVVARVLHVASPEESPIVASTLAVTVILVVGTNLTTELAVERFGGIVVGALFAIIASYVASPTKATRALEDNADDIQEKLGTTARTHRGRTTRQPRC